MSTATLATPTEAFVDYCRSFYDPSDPRSAKIGTAIKGATPEIITDACAFVATHAPHFCSDGGGVDSWDRERVGNIIRVLTGEIV